MNDVDDGDRVNDGSEFCAVVTGGNQGIGAAIVARLLERDYRVVSVALQPSPVTHPKLQSLVVDLLDNAAVAAAAAQIADRCAVSHLIHNAGVIRANPLEQTSAADLAALAQLHQGAALTLLQAFLPAMKQRRFGRVLFNASRAALGAPSRTAYGASKAGIIGMARTWALELAGYGITVNVVAPGPVLTDNFWGVIPKDSPQQRALAERIPVGRIGSVDDVARAFLFFAAADAGYITGQTLYVCGGASLGATSLL